MRGLKEFSCLLMGSSLIPFLLKFSQHWEFLREGKTLSGYLDTRFHVMDVTLMRLGFLMVWPGFAYTAQFEI